MFGKLSKTIPQESLDLFLTKDQQESFHRIKTKILPYQGWQITNSQMDAMLEQYRGVNRFSIDSALCKLDFIYFCNNYCYIKSVQEGAWVLFKLWPIQEKMVERVMYGGDKNGRFRLILPKTRQIGNSWTWGCAYPVWMSYTKSDIEVLIYSSTERLANDLLDPQHMRGTINRIPKGLFLDDAGSSIEILPPSKGSNKRQIVFTNGSVIYSLNPNEGDSRSSKYTFIDEADMFNDLQFTLDKAEPATEYGKLIIGSRCEKKKGDTKFKQMAYEAAYTPNDTEYECMFIPWYAPPGRDEEWYKRETKGRDIDYIYSNYPATLEQALAPSQLDKRIMLDLLESIKGDLNPIKDYKVEGVNHPSLLVYEKPDKKRKYYLGVDAASGVNHGDNAVIIVVNDLGQDVCNLAGKIRPPMLASYALSLSKAYFNAKILPENNNHGGSFIDWLDENGGRHLLLKQERNSNQYGWNTNVRSKVELYDTLDNVIQRKECTINDPSIFSELASIESDKLKAPQGYHDDRAMAYALAQMARERGKRRPKLRIIDLNW